MFAALHFQFAHDQECPSIDMESWYQEIEERIRNMVDDIETLQ